MKSLAFSTTFTDFKNIFAELDQVTKIESLMEADLREYERAQRAYQRHLRKEKQQEQSSHGFTHLNKNWP
jgi:hypothetical protein